MTEVDKPFCPVLKGTKFHERMVPNVSISWVDPIYRPANRKPSKLTEAPSIHPVVWVFDVE